MTIKVERVKDSIWTLTEAYTCSVFPELTLVKGFTWNGASIPQIVKNILSNEDYGVLEASGSHDFLYANKGNVNYELTLTRKQVDTIFLHELLYYGIPSWKAYSAYYSVRTFGKSHWG